MTTDLKKTLIFAGVALVLVAMAYVTTRPRNLTAEEFTKDQGKPFFPDFKDPRDAQALEVIDFDPDTAQAIPFKVEFEKGKGWAIPSHHDYPADAKDRLAKTAAGVIDLKKDVIVSDDPDQHEELGVIDPLDTKATSLKGRGKRVTLKGEKGNVLADLIIGKSVKDRPGQKYVRVPGQKRTYGVNVNVDLTARFGDWIETNLLKLDAFKVEKIKIDNHKVDPEAGTVTPGDEVVLDRKDSSSPWIIAPPAPEGQELDTSKISTMTSALGDLKIVGVRPKPEGLTAQLKGGTEEGGVKLSRPSLISLQSKGFYMTRDGRLLSNQGDVYVSTEDGVLYILRFGEVTVATGEALTAGKDEDSVAKKEAEKKTDEKDKEKKPAAGDNRYLLVMAQFEPDLIPKPKTLQAPEAGKPELPEHAFARTAEEIKADEDKAKRDKEDYDKKLADGKKKAKELTDRFAAWYYVVPGDAFRNVVLDRAALLKAKGSTPPDSAPPPGGFGGMPPGMSLPPGLNIPGGPPSP